MELKVGDLIVHIPEMIGQSKSYYLVKAVKRNGIILKTIDMKGVAVDGKIVTPYRDYKILKVEV